jgi:hypothetical protein
LDSNPCPTPAIGKLLEKEGARLPTDVPYREAIGTHCSLLWLAIHTRPDINFAVVQVARFSHAPTTEHWIAVKQIFRYLVGTINFVLVYKSSKVNIKLKFTVMLLGTKLLLEDI